MDGQDEMQLKFRIGSAFPAGDPVAGYVMRLSIALGDLRIAAKYACREEQQPYERIYFVRLLAAHLHELTILFKPPDPAIPPIEDVVGSISSDIQQQRQLHEQHRRVRHMLDHPLGLRPNVRLGSELSRIRNGFFHYHRDAGSALTLTEAMRRTEGIESSYSIRHLDMRANYADEVANQLLHPWEATGAEYEALLRDLHEHIIALIDPVTDFLHHVEAAWLTSRTPGAVRKGET